MSTHSLKPVLVTFVMCREMFAREGTGELLLVGPGTDLVVPHFPMQVTRSLYVELTSCRGEYLPRFEVVDAEDKVLWYWKTEVPFQQSDPLCLHILKFTDLPLPALQPGRFDLILKLNGEEFARRPLRVALQGHAIAQAG